MPQLMTKEEARARPARRDAAKSPLPPRMRARAEELERKLGRPLRPEIDGPLTDEQSEEVLLARMMEDDRIPLDELLAKHGRG